MATNRRELACPIKVPSLIICRLQTNVLSTGLLGVLLLPFLEETAKKTAPSASANLKPHLTITGSVVHFWSNFKEGKDAHPIHALNDHKRFNSGDRYNVSKLLNLYLARDIGARASNRVVVNVVSLPGRNVAYPRLHRNQGTSRSLQEQHYAGHELPQLVCIWLTMCHSADLSTTAGNSQSTKPCSQELPRPEVALWFGLLQQTRLKAPIPVSLTPIVHDLAYSLCVRYLSSRRGERLFTQCRR